MSLTATQRDYQKNKEAYIARAKKSYSGTFKDRKSRLHRMVCEAKSRAKKKEIVFSITDSDLKWNDICPVLNIPITYHRLKGHGGDDNSPSIDRIDNSKGYIKGNVRLISNKANKLKNRMTKDECRMILENWDVI